MLQWQLLVTNVSRSQSTVFFIVVGSLWTHQAGLSLLACILNGNLKLHAGYCCFLGHDINCFYKMLMAASKQDLACTMCSLRLYPTLPGSHASVRCQATSSAFICPICCLSGWTWSQNVPYSRPYMVLGDVSSVSSGGPSSLVITAVLRPASRYVACSHRVRVVLWA